jgi:DNA helicase IV
MTHDDELLREQAALDRAYDELAAMRARAQGLLADLRAAGQPDPDLEFALARRLKLLADTGRPLCFGRIDGEDGTTWYLGRRHVEDRAADPVVLEWRVPAATPFYQARPADPMGLRRRRQFLLDGRHLVSYADDRFGTALADGADGDGPRLRGGDALLAELERARTGTMSDIVATIQAEQDAVIRAPRPGVLAVQGGPGTGKTAIGLHRAAYLLYNHPQLANEGVLVVGPTRTFLRYIAQVLPSLGEEAVVHVAVRDLVQGLDANVTDPPAVARVKGDVRMAGVLGRALAARRRPVRDDLVVDIGLTRVRLPRPEVESLVAKIAGREGPYQAGRAALRAQLVSALHRAAVRAGHHGLDRSRVSREAAGGAAFRSLLDEVWPAVSARALVADLLGSGVRMAAAAAGLLEPEEIALLAGAAADRRRGRFSTGDLALVDEAQALLHGRGRTYGHAVVDEAQDLTPMQFRMIARRCPGGSITVLGDLAQATGPDAPGDWRRLVEQLPRPDGWSLSELTLGYRAPAAVLDFASRLLPVAAPGVRATLSVRTGPHQPALLQVGPAELHHRAATEAVRLAGEGLLVGCIAAAGQVTAMTRALAGAGAQWGLAERDGLTKPVTLLDPAGAKGLEFDAVVVVEPAAIAAGDAGLRLLYVALTRPIQHLSVVFASPLPAPLAGTTAA